MTIDNKLTFSKHISVSDICKKTSQKVSVLTRLRNLIPCSAKLKICKSNIVPHLKYCDTAWHFRKTSDKRKLERIQERALRAVFKAKTEPYKDLLIRAGPPSLQNNAILMFIIKNGLAPSYITEIFDSAPNSCNLRNKDFDIQYAMERIFYITSTPPLGQTKSW